MNRRDFIKNLGMTGLSAYLTSSPWLSAFSETSHTKHLKARIAVIGAGSRGRHLMTFLNRNEKAEIVALYDIYQPSLDRALERAPGAKVYKDYREILDNKEIDALLIATPLNTHYDFVMQAMDAGKHVFCEKSIGYTMEECFNMYRKHKETNLIFLQVNNDCLTPAI